MVAPLVVAGATLAAGGLAGSILGRKKIPNYDIGRINQLIEQGGTEQRRLIGNIRPETTKLTDQYRTDITGAKDAAGAARATERARYLKEIDPVASRLMQNQTDQLKRSTFGQLPETQQAVREALAASGGLGRGVAAEELARVPIEAARQYGEGVAGLQQESLRNQQSVLANLHSEESQAIATNLGIDQNTYNTILNSGNEALINELNGLVDESRRRTEALSQAEMFRQSGNVASASAENANRQAIFGSLTNLGGTMIGGGLPTGLPSGVQEVSTAQRKRRTVSDRNDIG